MAKASDKPEIAPTGSRAKASPKATAKKPSAKTVTAAKAPANAPAKAVAKTPAATAKPRVSAKPKAAPTAPVATARASRKASSSKAEEETSLADTPLQDHLGEDESANSRNTMEGSRLIKLIKKVIVDRGLQDRSIADIMGITVIYWNSLANGNRKIKSLGKDKFQMIANFLGLPLIQVYNLADFFTPEDFIYKKDLDEQLWLSIVKMGEDPQWAGYVPTAENWQQTPLPVRMTMVLLYEQLAQKQLLAKAEIEVPQIKHPKR